MRGSASSAARSTARASSATSAVGHCPTEASLSSGSAGGAGAAPRRAGELVLVGEPGDFGRARGKCRDPGLGQIGVIGVADPVSDPGADPDAPLGRRREALDLAGVGAYLAPGLLGQVGLGIGGAGCRGRLDGAPCQLDQTSVPPTVIAPILTWPWPVPTGTFCPALPQTPVFISKSLATASIAISASRQLPTRVAPRQGRVTRPPSIR